MNGGEALTGALEGAGGWGLHSFSSVVAVFGKRVDRGRWLGPLFLPLLPTATQCHSTKHSRSLLAWRLQRQHAKKYPLHNEMHLCPAQSTACIAVTQHCFSPCNDKIVPLNWMGTGPGTVYGTCGGTYKLPLFPQTLKHACGISEEKDYDEGAQKSCLCFTSPPSPWASPTGRPLFGSCSSTSCPRSWCAQTSHLQARATEGKGREGGGREAKAGRQWEQTQKQKHLWFSSSTWCNCLQMCERHYDSDGIKCHWECMS